MDLTAAAANAVAGDITEKGNVGIICLSHNTIPNWPPALKYKECLKNHAARLGGHAVDGCGEFLSSPAATPSDPKSLECVACGCHRNFHRPDDDSISTNAQFLSFRRYPIPIPLLPPPPPPHHHVLLHHPIRSEDNGTVLNRHQENPNGRKRHRTKFTRDQKEKMLGFSEKLGWKIQKSDEVMVDEFCKEIGVGKGVLKVWMHNNKQQQKAARTLIDGILS